MLNNKSSKLMLLFLIAFSILSINIISATGLAIVGNITYTVNKTVTENIPIVFQLQNTESYAFYNVTFESNDYINMTKIDTIASGQIYNITATIISPVAVDTNVRIKGFYQSTIGASNVTHDVTVTYTDNAVSPCELTVIKGDKVNFINSVNDQIKLINAQTNSEITTIPASSSYIMNCDIPNELNYKFTRWGLWWYDDVCKITTLSDSGLVNNPQLDGILHLIVTTNYMPTTIDTLFLQTNYSLDFYSTDEGMFQIMNIGNQTAKNVILEGEWFSFGTNGFDIEPSKSKTISYTVKPKITLNTNSTNMTYYKQIKISGNFNTVIKDFNVFIKYADIGSANDTNAASIAALITKFCTDNPDICGGGSKVIVQQANESDSTSVNVSQEMLRGILQYIFTLGDNLKAYEDYAKINFDNMSNTQAVIYARQENSTIALNAVKEQGENNYTFAIAVACVTLTVIIVATCGLTYLEIKKRKEAQRLRQYG